MSMFYALRVKPLNVFAAAISFVAFCASSAVLQAGLVGQYSLGCKHVSTGCRTPCGDDDICGGGGSGSGNCFPKCISRNLKCDRSCDVQRVKGFCEPRNDCRDYVRDCREYDNDCQKCEQRCDPSRSSSRTANSSGRRGGNLVASVLKVVKNRFTRNGSNGSQAGSSNNSNQQNSGNHSSNNNSSSNNSSNNQASNQQNQNSSGSNSQHSNNSSNGNSSNSGAGSQQNSNNQSSHQNQNDGGGRSNSNNQSNNHQQQGHNSSQQNSNNNSQQANNGPGRNGNSQSSNNSNSSNNSQSQSSTNHGPQNHGNGKPFSQSSLEKTSYNVVEFSVKADAGKTVLITGLSFKDKANCYGPQSGIVQYSFDGFETVADRFCFDLSQCWQTECWDFCDFVLNPCQTVDFRFIFKDALNWCYGTYCLADVKVKGHEICDPPVSTPEPGSLSLAAMALVLGFGSRYKTRRRKA